MKVARMIAFLSLAVAIGARADGQTPPPPDVTKSGLKGGAPSFGPLGGPYQFHGDASINNTTFPNMKLAGLNAKTTVRPFNSITGQYGDPLYSNTRDLTDTQRSEGMFQINTTRSGGFPAGKYRVTIETIVKETPASPGVVSTLTCDVEAKDNNTP